MTSLLHMITGINLFLGSSGGNPGNTGDVIFQEAGKGKLDCSELNGESISGESECKSAAVKLEKEFSMTETDPSYPKGCYVFDDEVVYWNQDRVGATDQRSSPICKVGGNNNF